MSIIRYKNLPTSREGIRVHITGYTGGDTGCTLRGYAVDDHGVRIDGSKTLRRIAKTAAAIPAAEQHLVAAAMKNLPRAATKTKKKTDDVIDTDKTLFCGFYPNHSPNSVSPHNQEKTYMTFGEEGLQFSLRHNLSTCWTNDPVRAEKAEERYKGLEDEKTKLWHLSAKALYELYRQEKQLGKIDFPEEA